MCNETPTNLCAVFTITACPTPCWFDSCQKALSKNRGNYKFEKVWKAIWTLSMNDFMLVKVSIFCQFVVNFDIEIFTFKEI